MILVLDQCMPDREFQRLAELPGVESVHHISEFGWSDYSDYRIISAIGYLFPASEHEPNSVLFITIDSSYILSSQWLFRAYRYPQLRVYSIFDFHGFILMHFPGCNRYARICNWKGRQKIDLAHFLCEKYWLPELKKLK